MLGIAVAVLSAVGSAQSSPGSPATAGSDTPKEEQVRLNAKLRALSEAQSKLAARRPASKMDSKAVPGQTGRLPAAITFSSADRNLQPEQPRAQYEGPPSQVYMQYETTCKPTRVAAGGSGRLAVLMLLSGNAVMLASGATGFDLQPVQGALTIGKPQFRPAGPARVAEAFRGKAAYDVYAIFDVPFTVAADAAPGAQPVNLELAYELYDDKTGGLIERFRDHVTVEVLIDRTEAVAVANARPAPATIGATVTPPRAETGAEIGAEIEADSATPVDGDLAPPDGASNLLIMAAGGVLLVFALLLLRRRVRQAARQEHT